MSEIKEFLKNYEQIAKGKNISDFDVIDVDDLKSIEWKTDEFPDEDGNVKQVKRMYCKIHDELVVIPIGVMNYLKKVEEDVRVGSVKTFAVNKSGSGLLTKYEVMVLSFTPKEEEKV